MNRALLRALVLAVVAVGCATNPATGRRQFVLMSEAEEIALGRQSDAEVRQQMGVYRDDRLQQYVERVGRRLAAASHRPNLPWTFTVVDEPAVNAFALPGGFIYITRGILPFLRNEAELAAVLGHEVGHVDARHSVAQYTKQTLTGGLLAVGGAVWPQGRTLIGAGSVLSQFVFLKYSRDAELEADRLGVGYAAQSGWQPDAMPGLLGTLAKLDAAQGSSRGVPNWALTHPPAEDRVARVQEAVALARTSSSTGTNAAEFEPYLDGLVFGDSREKGIVRGREFLHPILRFALTFPESWQVTNSDDQVSARPDGSSNAAMMLELAQGTGPVSQLAVSQMTEAGWQQVAGQRESINGLEAYVGTYRRAVNNTAVTLRAAHVRAGQQTYVVAGLAPSDNFPSVEGTFASAIGSFRALSEAEAERIQPSRIDFRVARSGDTWESLARDLGKGTVTAASLAIMNGRDVTSPPRTGERLRVVVGG
jgi:predicted Zn-dependent protease